MKQVSKHVKFFIVFLLLAVITVSMRLYWIKNALPAKAVVQYIHKSKGNRNSPSQSYPVVKFSDGYSSIEGTGSSNLPVAVGQSLNILYNPNDVNDWKINTPYWLWFDIWSWYRLVLFVIVLYYVVRFIKIKSE